MRRKKKFENHCLKIKKYLGVFNLLTIDVDMSGSNPADEEAR